MRRTLELEGMSLSEVNEASRSLIALLRGLDPGVRFLIGNSIWYREGFAVEQPFLDANRTYFDAEVAALDFASPAAPQRINDWVTRRTQGLITEIVPSPIPEGAVMYLINAIYFKGDWTQRFDRERTKPAPFHLADGSTVQVPMMRSATPLRLRASRNADFEVAELPYGGQAGELPRRPRGVRFAGPGGEAKRQTRDEAVIYLSKRAGLMQYRRWREQEPVIARRTSSPMATV